MPSDPKIIENLIPFVSGYKGFVETLNAVFLKLCLPSQIKEAKVVVSVDGLNGTSAFSTYMCSREPCLPSTSNSSVVDVDYSDTMVNTVTAAATDFSNYLMVQCFF